MKNGGIAFSKIIRKLFALLTVFAVIFSSLGQIAYAVAVNAASKTDVAPGTQFTTFKGAPVFRLNIANSGDAADTITTLSPTPSGTAVDTKITLHFFKDVNNNGVADQGDVDLGASAAFAVDNTKKVFDITDVAVPALGSVSILITADGLALANTDTFTLGFALAADIVMAVTPVGSFALTNANALTASSIAPAVTVANGANDPAAKYVAASATNVAVKQLAISAAAGTSDAIVSIAPTPSGTENEATNISSVVFYIDSGSVPGQVDGTDIQLVSTPATFSADNTKTTFTFSNPVQITQGTAVNLLAVYNLGAGAANAATLIETIVAAGDAVAGSGTAVTKTATASSTITIDKAPTVSSAAAYADRIIVNFSENVDGMQASNCANYTVGGSVVACSGPGTPFIDFQGNKATIRGLPLSGTTTLAIAGSVINDIDGPQNALAAYSSGSLTVNALILPAITNINPTSGAIGASITITGTNFGTGTAGDATHKVFFSGGFSQSTGPLPPIEADYTGATWAATSIAVKVPAGAQGGPVNVMVDGVMSDMSSYSFFDIAGSYAAKVYYSADNATPMPDGDAVNIRIVTAGMGGLTVHWVGGAGANAMTYDAPSDTFTITGVSSMGGVWAFDATGAHLNSSGGPIDISATQNLRLLPTTRKISGTLTIGASCVAGGQNKNLVVFAMPDAVDSGASGFKEMEPAVFVTGSANGQIACQTTYSIGVPVSGTYRVEAHIPPESSGGLTISSAFTDPGAQLVTITDAAQTATGKNFTFSAATHKIMGHVQKPSGSFGTEERNMLWAFAYQPQEGGKGTGTQIDASGNFTVYVTPGVWKVGIGGPNMPSVVEIQVDVDSTYALASYTATTKTIVIAPPSDFIEGYAKDAAGNGLANTSIYAWREGGPGGGNATTDSQGYYKMYVTPGSGYHVGAQSQTYGFLGENSGITVSTSAHPTVNFTVSSANNYTISGTILKGVVGLQQAFVFVTEGERGPMMGGGGTDSSGAYSIKVAGGANRYFHVGLPGKGEIYTENLGTVGANIPNKDVTINSSTIIVKISPASAVSQAFVGAHSDQGGGFSNTDVSTDAGIKEYHIEVPRPAAGTRTYYVEGGVPGYGPLTQAAVGITSAGAFTETSGTANDGTIEYTLSDLYTVSGTITGTNTTDAWVWASGPNGGGGGSVSSNAYSIKLRNGTYDLGVSKPGYIGNKISITVNGANLPDQNLILSSAAQTITGSVYLPDGTTKVTNAWVWAENGTGGWSGGSTDGNGDYTLNVGAGDWTVKAAYDGYNSNGRGVTAPASSVNITLSAISGFASNTQNSPITPSEGGVMQGTGIKVDLPKNVLGTGTTAATLELKSTTNAPSRASTNLIGSTQKEITARNGNQIITTLSGSATVEMTVSKAELVSEGLTLDQAKKIKISYFDSTSGGNWVEVPTAVTLSVPGAVSISDLNDSVAITLSGTTSHFSTFAPTLPTSGDAPATPANLSVGAGATSATLTWTAVSGATKYDIYQKSGDTYPYLAQTTQTSYTINGLSANVAYYFKVSALNDSNNESAATAAVSVVPGVAAQGGTTVTTTPTPTPTPSPTPTPTSTPAPTPTPTTTTGPATPAAPSGVTLYRAEGDNRVYVIKEGKKSWVKSAEEFTAAGYKWSDIKVTTPDVVAAYPDATVMGITVKIVNTSTLRVRQSNTTQSGILSSVKQNEVFTVIEQKSGWYKIKTSSGVVGWVSGAYATVKNDTMENTNVFSSGATISITAASLRVRSSGGASGSILGAVKRNENYSVIEEKNGWYKIKTAKGIVGWVSGLYAEKK